MQHPFDITSSELEVTNLEFENSLAYQEAENVNGGSDIYTTLALGEEGGFQPPCYPVELPPVKRPPIGWPRKPPVFTTLAVGEEGGSQYPFA
jgi:hypothetical protein